MNKLVTLITIASLGVSLLKAPQPFTATTIEERAAAVGLSMEDFELFSSVVEAESNRSTDGNLEGRIYIALVIWNRASEDHPEFGNDPRSVLTQSGQFSTVRGGHSVTARTDYSDEAVIRAYEWLQSGEAPDVLFFNCRSFFQWREPYNPDRDGDGIPDGAIAGNYFSL